MNRRIAAVLGGAALVGGIALPALAAGADQGWRYDTACTAGTDNRPAVTWWAWGEVDVTPPGAGYELYCDTNGYWDGTTNGGLMDGGKWVVYSNGNVSDSGTYGSCTQV